MFRFWAKTRKPLAHKPRMENKLNIVEAMFGSGRDLDSPSKHGARDTAIDELGRSGHQRQD
jgi:hypothetical protein